jgi:hypothetical protein
MKTCSDCGSQIKGYYATRCKKCAGALRRKGKTNSCRQCGKEFYVQPAVTRETRFAAGTYCSRKCTDEAKKGQLPPRANIGQPRLHHAGYVLVWKPDHPRSSGGRVFEHILVMEEKLGRSLVPGEQVHHKDKDKTNNHPDNLEVHSNSDHQKIHMAERDQHKRVTVHCEECGSPFELVPWKAFPPNPAKRVKYCSEKCKLIGRGKKISATKLAKNKK